MNILLLSSLVGAKYAFERFIEKYEGKEITFIDTASKKESYTKYVDDAREYFTELGFKIRELEVSDVEEAQAKEIIENTDILYIAGGNSFYLLQELKKKNLLDFIKQRVDEGMVYIGESAGAVIASPNIAYIEYMDDPSVAPELESTDSLGLVGFYTLPHWGEEPFKELAEKIYNTYAESLKLWVVDNKGAIRHLKDNEYAMDLGDEY